MNIQFSKYQGAGNDFILFDNRDGLIDHQRPEFISNWCDRRFGIGADGMMFLQNKPGFDFEMVYYNADGRPSSMCGNGGRCIVAFARDLGVIKDEANFLAVDGPHHAKISENGWVSLGMIDVNQVDRDGDAYVLNTGSPHYVLLDENIAGKDVFTEGRRIRNSPNYQEKGINVNFVEDSGDHYAVRTYERGVEDETFACGTGVTAVALAMAKLKGQTGNISTPIKALGGNLNIRFHSDGLRFSNIFLEGPAEFVFNGQLAVNSEK